MSYFVCDIAKEEIRNIYVKYLVIFYIFYISVILYSFQIVTMMVVNILDYKNIYCNCDGSKKKLSDTLIHIYRDVHSVHSQIQQ